MAYFLLGLRLCLELSLGSVRSSENVDGSSGGIGGEAQRVGAGRLLGARLYCVEDRRVGGAVGSSEKVRLGGRDTLVCLLGGGGRAEHAGGAGGFAVWRRWWRDGARGWMSWFGDGLSAGGDLAPNRMGRAVLLVNGGVGIGIDRRDLDVYQRWGRGSIGCLDSAATLVPLGVLFGAWVS